MSCSKNETFLIEEETVVLFETGLLCSQTTVICYVDGNCARRATERTKLKRTVHSTWFFPKVLYCILNLNVTI